MGISRMETRSFDSLMGRTIALIPGDGETYRFIFESIFGPSAVLKPVDLKSTAYAKAVEQKVVVPIEASIDGGKAMAEVTVERWSERTGALRVYRPKEVVLEQRRRDRRLSVRFPLELGVMRDGELRTVRTIQFCLGLSLAALLAALISGGTGSGSSLRKRSSDTRHSGTASAGGGLWPFWSGSWA
jgi:hypothetical protein